MGEKEPGMNTCSCALRVVFYCNNSFWHLTTLKQGLLPSVQDSLQNVAPWRVTTLANGPLTLGLWVHVQLRSMDGGASHAKLGQTCQALPQKREISLLFSEE